jgi:hypothetical protein
MNRIYKVDSKTVYNEIKYIQQNGMTNFKRLVWPLMYLCWDPSGYALGRISCMSALMKYRHFCLRLSVREDFKKDEGKIYTRFIGLKR